MLQFPQEVNFPMNNIITIGREFGSGGRELGRLLSEILGVAYYDREIISEIAKRTSLSEKYIQHITERKPIIPFPIHTGRTFWAVIPDYNQSVQQEQHAIIQEMAAKSPCVIVGRCADYILRDSSPFRLFVYSDMASKIARCRKNERLTYRETRPEVDESGQALTDKELSRRIEQINKGRADYYEFYTGQTWGDKSNYDLCINTAKLSDLKGAAGHIAKICSC